MTCLRITPFQAEELEDAVARQEAADSWFTITWRGAVPWIEIHDAGSLREVTGIIRARYAVRKAQDRSFVSAWKSLRLLSDRLEKEL